jgi:glutamate 5-kinase
MKRVVVKVGSAVLTQDNKIAKDRMINMVALIADLKKEYDVVLVTSGAVAAGYDVLKVDKNQEMNKRALAAAGQPILMGSYKRRFDLHDIHTAQILLREVDFDSRRNVKMFQEIVDVHLAHGLVPIINENDVASRTEELFGDNDQLSAEVAHAIDAELLVILSDIAGYYDKNPKEFDDAKLYKETTYIPEEALECVVSPNHEFATGGIVTKLKAADYMMKHGRKMFLCSGFDLTSARSFLLQNKHMQGTLFLPAT